MPDRALSAFTRDRAVPGSDRNTDKIMKFSKVKNVRGFNHNHGTKFVLNDLNRSNELYNFEAGVNRMPRRDSKFWGHRFMVWDVENNCQVRNS
jgi:hypothetical protein